MKYSKVPEMVRIDLDFRLGPETGKEIKQPYKFIRSLKNRQFHCMWLLPLYFHTILYQESKPCTTTAKTPLPNRSRGRPRQLCQKATSASRAKCIFLIMEFSCGKVCRFDGKRPKLNAFLPIWTAHGWYSSQKRLQSWKHYKHFL